ncbi:MAG TPA: glycosyltransferase [Sphingomicrobium sp.]|nr:glycosyltransferase [Sphingomicrobium sp.]
MPGKAQSPGGGDPGSAWFLISHSHFGGAQELWANLVQGFRDQGWSARLIALYPDEEGEQETPHGIGWSYVLPARPGGALGVWRLIRALVRELRTHPPDVIFTALPAANVIVPTAVALARVGTRVVITHHTPAETYNRVLDAADGVTGRVPAVKSIVCVSDAVAHSLADKPAAYRAKLTTIRNAVPPPVEAELARLAALHAPRTMRRRTIVCSGRLAYQKNYPVVVRAMQHLPDVQLEIVGAGPDEAALRVLADQLGVSPRIRFLGQKSRMEALAIVASADIFVQMSLFEGNSLSLIEAAKLGLPLIVSDVPEQREGITDPSGRLCGMTVPTEDHVALADAVRSLLDDASAYQAQAARSTALGESIRFEKLIAAYLSLR